MTHSPKIAYVGMTHLGLCSSISAASKGFDTLGFDLDPDLVGRLNEGKLPVNEPELDELLRDNSARIAFSTDPEKLAACDVIYVAPDVPTDDAGQSDLAKLEQLLALVVEHARAGSVIVVLSQVPPGFTRARQRPGRPIYYQVETLVFGRAVERATRPERFIVGCPGDPAQPLPGALTAYLEAFGCPILPMRLESAEFAKISINCCLVASVTVANTLAELCERIGADWSEIVPALKLDARIGPRSYLAPGLGIAGGNLERDLATVVNLGDMHGTDVGTVRAWQANSRYRRDWLLRMVHAHVLADKPDAKLALLGLAYKENTHSTKNSPALALLAALQPTQVVAYDPVVKPQSEWHPNLTMAHDPLSACDGVDAVVIATPWPQFKELSPSELAARMHGRVVIDPFACLNRAACMPAGLVHLTLGYGALPLQEAG